jgi:hypothetical protein
MPLSAILGVNRLAERIQLLRKNPFTAYGIAIAAVAVAIGFGKFKKGGNQ